MIQGSRGLQLFSKIVMAATVFLIFAGGMVTSTGSGLAVPDWPLSYGMVFPPMIGGVFYEHGHRMVAATVGMLTVVLTIWLWRKESRTWVRRVGYAAMSAVVLQGLLGGLTVLFLLPKPISIGHAVLGQTFFVLTVVIAYLESKEFRSQPLLVSSPLWKYWLAFTLLIYLQLILAATMRHFGAGLAVPDFPTMARQWYPSWSSETIERVNAWRLRHNLEDITAFQIQLHLLHRLVAVIIVAVYGFLWWMGRRLGDIRQMNSVSSVGAVLCAQFMLGALTVLSKRHPVVTSLHVVVGAITLGLAVLTTLRLAPWPKAVRVEPTEPGPRRQETGKAVTA
jgi:cytochrome c oxidase assembly protein subunit 15